MCQRYAVHWKTPHLTHGWYMDEVRLVEGWQAAGLALLIASFLE